MEQGEYPRVVYDMSNKDYHEAEGISSTGLKAIRRSPAHYKSLRSKLVEQTESQRIGELTHLALFEYSRFKDSVVVGPEGRRDSKAYKEFEAANVGKLVIKPDDAAVITGICDSIMAHPLARELFTGGRPEVSVFAKCPRTDVVRKVRPDYLRDDNLIIDLKTTKNAQMGSFQRDLASFRYHLSAAYYLDTVNLTKPEIEKEMFLLVVVEKEPPYGVMVYNIEDESLQAGRTMYEQCLDTYAECLKTDTWPSYGGVEPGIMGIQLPTWAFGDE